MSMAGRMSVFIRLVESNPKMAISEQSTAMVYGRRRARRTIHIRNRLRVQDAAAFDAAPAVRMQAQTAASARPLTSTRMKKRSAALGARLAAAGRFLPDPKHGLRGRHAPTGLRHRRGVQREPTTP